MLPAVYGLRITIGRGSRLVGNWSLILAEIVLPVGMATAIKKFLGFLHRGPSTGIQVQPVRHRFVDWRMLKDYRKRLEVQKYGKEKLRLNSLRKNRILPPELQAIADEEVAALPRYSNRAFVTARCVVTSRSRSVVRPYRLSRIYFRHLADYNFLSGWQRAMW